MFSVFLSSYSNTCGSLEELKKAVKTLACQLLFYNSIETQCKLCEDGTGLESKKGSEGTWSYLFRCLANFGVEWKSRWVYLVRLFFIADLRLVLGDTPLSLAVITEIENIWKSQRKSSPETWYQYQSNIDFVHFLISLHFTSLILGIGSFLLN